MEGMVRPMVKIHVVNIDTGLYIKSKKRPVAAPLTTRWVIIDLYVYMIVGELFIYKTYMYVW